MTVSHNNTARLAAGLLAAVLMNGGANIAIAAAPAAAPSTRATIHFDIPAGPLAAALGRFAEISGIQLVYGSGLTQGLQSPGLKGDFAPADALARLLVGTGLTAHMLSATSATLEKSAGAHILGPVQVEGVAGAAASATNGSTDATATEATRSYTSSALSIASKTPQSIKETPQSVSVITQQRMQDQNLTDFTSLMNQTTGVTVVTGGSAGTNLDTTFYSRGFAIRSIQIDGGAPLLIGGGGSGGTNNDFSFHPQIDLAMFDHAEILRGADGLFTGYGDPSGAVNLTRKRPLDHPQVVIEGAGGSWQDYREMIDATAPLGFDDRLRGRFVVNNQRQDYFYDIARDKHTLIYGILEADLTRTTLVSVGFSDTREDAVPWNSGLPRYENGNDLNLPRSTCLCVPWNRELIDTQELFAQGEQHLGDRWSIKLNLGRIDQQQRVKTASVEHAVNPTTHAGPRLDGVAQDNASLQTHGDLTVNGGFDLLGHSQQVLLGGFYQNVNGGGYQSYYGLFPPKHVSPAGIAGRPPVDVFNFDPYSPAFAEPGAQPSSTYEPDYGQKQWGAYFTLRLTPFDPLHFSTGVRYTRFEYFSHQQWLDPATGAVSADFPTYTYSTHNLSWPPAYSLVYDIASTVSAYASYADIYAEQSIYLDSSGHPLKPVTGSNVEAGVKFAGRGGKLNATLAAYRIEQKNFAKQVSDTPEPAPDGVHYCCYSANSNQVNLSEGVDAEVTGEVLPGWQLFAGYTYNLNEYTGSDAGSDRGQRLISLAPKHLFKLWTSYQFQQGGILHHLDVGGGINAQSASFNSGTACTAYDYGTDANGNETATCKAGATAPYAYTQGFYAVFSARIAYQFSRQWNVALNLNNIANRRYYQTMGTSASGNWYGDPRNFMLTIRGSF